MNFKHLIVVSLILVSYAVAGQNTFYYKKWKHDKPFPKQKIDLVFLTSDSAGEVFFQSMGKKIMYHLQQDVIGGNMYVRGADGDTLTQAEHLTVVFSFIRPMYVYLGGGGNKIPLCNRIYMRQTNNFPEKLKYMIETEISVSIDKEAEAMEPLAKSIAQRLRLQFPE